MSDGVVRAIGIALVALLASLLLRRMREEISACVRIGAVLLIFFAVLGSIRQVLDAATAFMGSATLGGYAEPMIRAIGLAFLCRICADICRDCGESGLAGGIESAGKAGILLLCLPLVQRLLETATELWQMGEG